MNAIVLYILGLLTGVVLTGWAYEAGRAHRRRAIDRALDEVRRELEMSGAELLWLEADERAARRREL